MTLRNRLIGGVVDGLMIAIDTITSFWQTPREVEWAKAAADGLAEREAEEEVAEPLSHFCPDCGPRDAEDVERCNYLRCKARAFSPAWLLNTTSPKTSAPTPGAVDGPAEGSPDKPSAVVDWDNPWPRTCADAGAQCKGLCTIDMRDGTIVDPDCFGVSNKGCSVSTPCGCPCVLDQHPDGYHACRHGDAFTPSAAVEPPASAPSVESPAPEFDWVTTAIPVIAGVLAEHKFLPIMGRCECPSLPRVADWQRWSEHVSPIIAIAIQSDLLSTIYEDTTFAITAFSGDRPRPLADFPKHQK